MRPPPGKHALHALRSERSGMLQGPAVSVHESCSKADVGGWLRLVLEPVCFVCMYVCMYICMYVCLCSVSWGPIEGQQTEFMQIQSVRVVLLRKK